MGTLRNILTPSQRALELELVIDPGFVHHRKIQTILGEKIMPYIDEAIHHLPSNLPEWQKKVRIDHIYTQVMLNFCKAIGIKTLEELLFNKAGRSALFCSTVTIQSCNDFYEVPRARNVIITSNSYGFKEVEINYSTNLVASDTLKSSLAGGNENISIIGQFSSVNAKEIIIEPIIMGFPWLNDPENQANFEIMWYHTDYYEQFIEDFDEFSKVKDITTPPDSALLQNISESVIKKCLIKIIGGSYENDWGGETSDLSTSHIHLSGKRVTASFLLKGPANFTPMKLNHLGKNNDQIVRLAKEPSQVLFVQHCHDISQPVRETLRAFAVQPGNPRRYCLIDGRDTLRLLQAYDLYDWAVEESNKKEA